MIMGTAPLKLSGDDMTAQKRDRLLKPPEVCNALGIDMPTFYGWVKQKRIQVVRLSARALRVKESEVDRIIDERTVEAVGE